MGMFDNYSNLNPNYIPNNLISRDYIYTTIDDEMPKDAKNILGIFSGYKWNKGEEFDFNLSCDFKIKVDPKSIIYKKSGESPTTDTVGYPGQNAYNTIDIASWTCTGKLEGHYIWVKDDDLTYPINADMELEMTPNMENSSLVLKIYNFRYEFKEEHISDNSSILSIHIDDEFYKKFTKDLYPIELFLIKDNKTRLIQKSCIIIC